jgi:hypothetical protein
MNRIVKYTAAAALTGALALVAATPSQARHGRNAAAIGFGAGALVGAAAANAAYNNGYYGPAYYGYAYAPGYYAYDAGPGYAYGSTDHYGASPYYDEQRTCMVSPASPAFNACN